MSATTDNSSLLNNHGIVSSHKFIVTIGTHIASFAKITGLRTQIETEYITEGGINSYRHITRSPKASQNRLIFEKGFGYMNPFYSAQGFVPGTMLLLPCTIIVLGKSDSDFERVFEFDNAMIISWEASPLDAMSSEIIIDRVELEHSGLREVQINTSRLPVPFTGLEPMSGL